MQGDYLFILTLTLTILGFLIQRTEAKYRMPVTLLLMFTVGGVISFFVTLRGLQREGWTALGIALLLNFLFWLLIGRYNPVGSSDENIQVLGMDD